MSMLQTDATLAEAFCKAVQDAAPGASIYFVAPLDLWVLPKIAEGMGIRVVGEVYPDLSYDDDGNVVVERNKGHTDLAAALSQLSNFLDHGRVRSLSGKWIPLAAESICVHGDGPNIVQLLESFATLLEERDIALAPVAVERAK
jgi:UPF0271 protein